MRHPIQLYHQQQGHTQYRRLMITILNIILCALFIEAVTQLIFHAAPLQPIRNWLRQHTPMFYSKTTEEHLLDCKYCTSVWVGFGTVIAYHLFNPNIFLTILFYSCIVHRISNYMHTIYSYVVDKQLDLRVARRKR